MFFTFFGALVVKNGLLNDIWSETIGALLVLANFGIVVYLIHYRWDTIMAYIKNEPDPQGGYKTVGAPAAGRVETENTKNSESENGAEIPATNHV